MNNPFVSIAFRFLIIQKSSNKLKTILNPTSDGLMDGRDVGTCVGTIVGSSVGGTVGCGVGMVWK